MKLFNCGHQRTKANTMTKSSRGNPYQTCRECQNKAQRDHQRRMERKTGMSQWTRLERTWTG